MSWVLALLGFVVLIVLHELGHFTAAKAVGMRVERFSLFFGRPLVSVRRGETEYAIGPIPAGGYVKITGMNPAEEIAPEVADRAYYRQPVWKRVVVIAAGPLVNLVLAFLIILGVYHFNGLATVTDRVASVGAGTPAATALRPGDRIVAVSGRRGAVSSVQKAIVADRCPGIQVSGCAAARPLSITVLRHGTYRIVALTPRVDSAGGSTQPRIGVTFAATQQHLGVLAASRRSVADMGHVTSVTVTKFSQIFTSAKARRDIHSVVGISDVVHQEFSFSTAAALYLLALVSLSLAIINLFPFLPLDGGHIFWALAEKVRGRAIPFSIMERASVIGFALVIGIFIIGFSNDIHTFTNGGFHVQ